MAMDIVILEDNADRCAEMRRCLADRFPFYPVRCFTDVPELVAHLDRHLDNAVCVCLDHDLELVPGADGRMVDPGDGRQAADYLAARPPQCPVVIHSTNTPAAVGMEQVLKDAGWQVTRVSPCDDLEWVANDWLRAVRRSIVGSAKPAAELSKNGASGASKAKSAGDV